MAQRLPELKTFLVQRPINNTVSYGAICSCDFNYWTLYRHGYNVSAITDMSLGKTPNMTVTDKIEFNAGKTNTLYQGNKVLPDSQTVKFFIRYM